MRRSSVVLIFQLARKDWRLFWCDPRAALLSFAVPIILASVFGTIFHRPAEESSSLRLPLLIVDQDGSTFSRAAVARLLASEQLEAREVDLATAEVEVENRRYGVAVVFREGFGAAVGRSNPTIPGPSEVGAGVTLLHHPAHGSESRWAEGVVTEAVMRQLAETYLGSKKLERPFQVDRETPASLNAHFSSYSHSFSGMALQYLLFWGMESGLLLLRERRGGVWHRLRSAPVPLWAMLTARATATALIALLMLFATFGFGWAVFGVKLEGSLLGFVLLAVMVSGLAASTGLLVATVGGTEARARSICILVILAVSMLGGLWLPAFLLPEWVRGWSSALPTSWAMRGFDAVTWQGGSFMTVLPSILAVAGFAVGCLTLALVRFLWLESRLRRGWTR